MGSRFGISSKFSGDAAVADLGALFEGHHTELFGVIKQVDFVVLDILVIAVAVHHGLMIRCLPPLVVFSSAVWCAKVWCVCVNADM